MSYLIGIVELNIICVTVLISTNWFTVCSETSISSFDANTLTIHYPKSTAVGSISIPITEAPVSLTT